MLEYIKHQAKLYLKPDEYVPQLGNRAEGGPSESALTFLMVCGTSFDIARPNAASTIRLGYCRAFARLGISYKLVSVLKLADEIENSKKPFVFLSEFDFEVLDRKSRRLLRDTAHFIWASPSRHSMYAAYARYGVPPKNVRVTSDYAIERVKDSGAAFLWATCPPSGLEHYGQYRNCASPLISLPLACDDGRYFPEPNNKKYANLEMVFVGGYWPNKAIQFDKYLRPYENSLVVFGHTEWPYKGYEGLLPDDDERILYQNAKLCPAISEPHAEINGDIVERVFKVAGSGGVAITDVLPYYGEIFSEDEILCPRDIPHYHELVSRALKDEDFNARYRASGIKAVLDRHTYVHRAKEILSRLKLG